MTIDPHHLACLEAALDLALELPRGPDGALTPEGKAHVKAALDQAEHDGPLHHWESMSEADWACFAASDWQPYTVTRGKNKGKQAWKHTKSGRISYEDPAAKEKERAGKEEEKKKAKEQAAAAKAKAAEAARAAKEKARADAAAKKKAEAEAAKAKAAAAKAKAEGAAKEQRRRAAEHIRDVVSGSATTTPAKVRAAGARLLEMTATELRALKAEIGAKGGGAAKAGIVQAITERALAARKAGKGKAAGKAKPVAAPAPAAAPAVKGAKAKPADAPPPGDRQTALTPEDAPAVATAVARAGLYVSRLAGQGLADLTALRGELGRAVPGLSPADYRGITEALIKARAIEAHGINETHQLTPDEREASLTSPAGKLLSVFRIADRGKIGPAVEGYLKTRGGKEAVPETALPGDQQAALEKRKFTGTDRLGRRWVNGKLVAAEEKPTSTADALRELQDARASTHHLPHQSMPLAELRDRLGLTDAQALDLARRLHREQGVTAETRSGDLLGQNGVADVVIPLGGVQPRHKAPATAEQVEAAVPKVEAAVREAATGLPPGGQVKIADLRRQLGLGRHEFDSAMHALRRAGKVKLDAISNLQRATPGELADAIPGVNETLFYVEPVGGNEQSRRR